MNFVLVSFRYADVLQPCHCHLLKTMGDRLQGLKEEIKGTLKHDPSLKQTGKDRITGELKRREQEEVSAADRIELKYSIINHLNDIHSLGKRRGSFQ